jgi:hypothetical protein
LVVRSGLLATLVWHVVSSVTNECTACCRGQRESLNQLNQRLLASNKAAVTDGSATAAALRHVPADGAYTLRTEPHSCSEANTLGVDCGGSSGGFSWTSAGGIVAMVFITLAVLALAVAACWCVRRRLKKEYGLENSADVSKSPETIQLHEKAPADDATSGAGANGEARQPSAVTRSPSDHKAGERPVAQARVRAALLR